ncbi:MAG TPA: hydrogenase maturation nickel metallochaperone HypA [candidate division Zixibacteria bacterium]|nr:hydrogenase maturation nickel metallochaperone HypA [candidate division Zixibacteria bacterium]
MHELMVTENILEITLRHAKQAGDVRVTDLYLVVGELSSVIDDSVQFYWDFVSEGTSAEGAKLHFRRIPAEFTCNNCGKTYHLTDNLTCPECESSDTRIIAGREFSLEAIEVSEDLPESPLVVADPGEGP